MLVDYHMHFEYGSYDEDWVKKFFESAKERGVLELGITEHSHAFKEFKDLYYDELILDKSKIGETQRQWLENERKFKYSLQEYVDFINMLKSKNYPVKLGIEVCNFRNYKKVEKILSEYKFDYIMLSIHFLNGWAFDLSSLKSRFDRIKISRLYNQYEKEVYMACKTDIYDVLGHPFNLRIYNKFPEKDITSHLEAVASILKDKNMAIDVNTGTLYRYPIKEISPYPEFMKIAKEYDLDVIVSSDAHKPEDAGKYIKEAVEYIKKYGYKNIIRFDNREKIIESI